LIPRATPDEPAVARAPEGLTAGVAVTPDVAVTPGLDAVLEFG